MTIALTTSTGTPLLRYCRWALAITVACMPLYVIRFDLGPVPTTLLETLIMLTIVLYIGAIVQSRSWSVQRTPVEIPTAIFLVAAAAGVLVSPNHLGALGIFRAYFLEPLLVFYIALDVVRTRRDLQLIAGAFLTGATVFAILNLSAWASALLQHQHIISTNAPEALYTSPNSVALFLEPAVALGGGIALFADSTPHRRLALISLAFVMPSLVLTLSRAGWLTLAILILVAVITVAARWMRVALLVGAAAGTLLVSRLPIVATRLAYQLDLSSPKNTFEGRVQIWSDTLRMLRDHPIFGAGLRAYQQTVAPYVYGGRRVELYPHDIWLAMWSEIGLLGLGAFIALVAILLWRGWRGFAAAQGFVRAVLWGTSSALVAIVVHGTFDTPYFKNDLSLEFWVVAALELAALGIMAGRRNDQAIRSAALKGTEG
jgi:putative inorganic carbon (HCO3(-)) transporter